MSSVEHTELGASAIIASIAAGEYPREVLLNISRGFLPLPQDDLIVVLSYISQLPDEETADLARTSLNDIPARSLHAFASSETASPEYLTLLSRASRDAHVLEALIRNRAVPDQAIIDLAARAEAGVQEIIVINQARILRAPGIIAALLENPNVTQDTRRRALETREEFFEKKARLDQLKALLADEEESIDDAASLDAIADLLELAVQEPAAAPVYGDAEITVADLEDSKKKSMWLIVSQMSIAEKVQLAFKGSRTIRMLLVKERNRIVSSAAIRNPRMSESEVEQVAALRNVEEDVLRVIGLRRDWTSKYPIALALVKNPKAPIGVVLPLINRLTLRDLRGLKDDKGVSEAVRANAKKLFQARQKS
jgi:hypothetical protein